MLVNPFSSPSTTYIIEPMMMVLMITKYRNTVILPLLAISAFDRKMDCPVNLGWFNILNNRSNRSARIMEKTLEPTKIMDKYMGKMASKSMMPKKLKMYFRGLLVVAILSTYSRVKKPVIIHSRMMSKLWYFESNPFTVSSITKRTLKRISPRRIRSNSLPATVSVP